LDLLTPDEIDRIEREFPDGLTARAIVEIFQPKGVRLSEATFRKYVQAELLPQSRRVGRKGKHRGSLGIYPVGAVRRINAIKKMMAEGLTLEDIRRSFLYFKNGIDRADRELDTLLVEFQAELEERPLGKDRRRQLAEDLSGLRRRTQELVKDLARLGSALTAQTPLSEGSS
jgi:DNA-binding transcriptional MerR regulator